MATEYVVRDTAGSVRNGTFPEGDPTTIYVAFSRDVSLNLSGSEVASYTRNGDNLIVVLQSGEVLVLDGYFQENATGPKNLFLSEEGQLVEVFLGDAVEGDITASYAALDVSGKWSAYDDLVFLDLGRVEPVVAPLAAPIIGGLGGLGGIAAGGAALAGAAVLAGGGGGGDDPGDTGNGGGGGNGPIIPTVNDPTSTQLVGGDEAGAPIISGTGEPGSTVDVTVNNRTITTTVDANGDWVAEFDPSDLPDDGVWVADVVVTAPDGTVYDLTGPTADIDTTPPAVSVTSGAESTGDLVNSASHANGAVIAGTSEAGATIAVTIDGTTHTTTADANGDWTVTFASSEITTGEYSETMTIVATDARGNSSTLSETLVVDTVQALTMDASVNGDYVINEAEHAAGVTFTGTAQAGSSVVVEFGGASHTVTADASGNWSATFASSEIAEGTYTATLTATATDGAGNVETASADVQIDTEIAVAVDSGQAGGDDIISYDEANSDITLTGTAEPGSSVSVTVAGVTQKATVDASGNWTAVFSAGSIPGGEYDTTVTALATDAAGNSATSTAAIRVDTVAGDVALSATPIEIDDVINAVERADGVDISGTATAGLTVTVTLGSATTTVVADANGNWTTTFAASDIPEGTQTLDITASITDAAGNSKSVSDTVQLDTVVENFAQSTAPIEGDNVINAVERADGVTVTGTVEPGSTVIVEMAGSSVPAIVDGFGNWSATFLPGSIPEGTYDTTVLVTSTDPAGNVDTRTSSVSVDTDLALTSDANQTADDTINAAEHTNGVTLAGTAEPGSSVVVELLGITRTATVDGNGNWSASFSSAELPEGTYSASATITATDDAGNTTSVTETFGVDTQVETPGVDSVTYSGDDVRRISTEDAIDSYVVNTLEAGGGVGVPASTVDIDPTFGTEFTFNTPVSDGTNLIVTRTDGAGNKASTLMVFEDDATTASTIGHAGASGFDIAALDLDYGEDANLVLTEAQIKALSDGTDTLTIHGGTDDTVQVAGAINTGNTQTIDGQTYNVYTIGNDGATLVIEQEINVII